MTRVFSLLILSVLASSLAFGQATGEAGSAFLSTECVAARTQVFDAHPLPVLLAEIDTAATSLLGVAAEMLDGRPANPPIDLGMPRLEVGVLPALPRVRQIIQNGSYLSRFAEEPMPLLEPVGGASPRSRREAVARSRMRRCLDRVGRMDSGAHTGVGFVHLSREMRCYSEDAAYRACGSSRTLTCINYLVDIGGSRSLPTGWPDLELQTPRYRAYLRAEAASDAARRAHLLGGIARELQPPLQARDFEGSMIALERVDGWLDEVQHLAMGVDRGRAEAIFEPLRNRLKALMAAFSAARQDCISGSSEVRSDRRTTRRRSSARTSEPPAASAGAVPTGTAGSTDPAPSTR